MDVAIAPQQVDTAPEIIQHLRVVRRQTLSLCEPLTPEDMMVQSCPEASPAKWHLAHTTWFFETFLLRQFLPGYQPFHPDFIWLFNSYYNSVSDQPAKQLRASFSRPGLDSILVYRAYVDTHLERLFAEGVPEECTRRLTLGLHHEQQHGELLLTDIKHALWSNPLRPNYSKGRDAASADSHLKHSPTTWQHYGEGVYEVGHADSGFCFDNEEPRHRVWLDSFKLSSNLVTCAEYLQFMDDGGYRQPDLWLSEGWAAVQAQQWSAPLYWHRQEPGDDWNVFTLRGDIALSELHQAPVCHLSYFEAEAYARWFGARLPAEGEWEVAAASSHPDPATLLEGGALHPGLSSSASASIFGDVWQWTASAYLGYPGYAALPGALGEYNGKFMCNQMVLRGGSVVTPASHIRASYRNFFSPVTRWQFSGIRLARR